MTPDRTHARRVVVYGVAIAAPLTLTALLTFMPGVWPRPYSWQFLGISIVIALTIGVGPAVVAQGAGALSIVWLAGRFGQLPSPLHPGVEMFALVGVTLLVLVHRLREAEQQLRERQTALAAASRGKDRLLARTTLLANASAALASSLDYETTLRTVSRLALPELADWCFTDVITDTGDLRRLHVSHSADPGMQRVLDEYQRDFPPRWDSDAVPVRAITTGRTIHVPHLAPETLRPMVDSEEHLRRVLALRMASVVSVPMRTRGVTVGGMTFVRHPERPPFDADDVVTLEDLAQRGAQALDTARVYEIAQQSNRAKDEFLATLSHELRTPLNVILGHGRMLRGYASAPDRVRKTSEIIERNALAQLRLVEDLLDVQRIIREGLQMEHVAFDLQTLGQSVMESLHPFASAKRLHWNGHFERLTIEGDRARIQQVIWNLLSNAIKFTPSGGCVGVSGIREQEEVVIRVEDSGEGIPAHFMPHLFEPFRQLDMSATRRHGGLGLGLALVKHIVEAHGGTIEAESQEGSGTRLIVRLPLRASATAVA